MRATAVATLGIHACAWLVNVQISFRLIRCCSLLHVFSSDVLKTDFFELAFELRLNSLFCYGPYSYGSMWSMCLWLIFEVHSCLQARPMVEIVARTGALLGARPHSSTMAPATPSASGRRVASTATTAPCLKPPRSWTAASPRVQKAATAVARSRSRHRLQPSTRCLRSTSSLWPPPESGSDPRTRPTLCSTRAWRMRHT